MADYPYAPPTGEEETGPGGEVTTPVEPEASKYVLKPEAIIYQGKRLIAGFKKLLTGKMTDEISSTSTSEQIASASAVYDFVNDALDGVTSFEIQFPATLPTEGEKGIFYYVPRPNASAGIFDKWVWYQDAWKFLGSDEVDLSNVWSKDELTVMTTARMSELLDEVFADND